MTPREDGVTDGRRPDGNRAEVEVVSTSDLLPGNVVWCEDGWYAVLDSDQNDSTQVSAAQIIDDAGGQDEDGLLYGEWFLRLAHPAATAREEAGPSRDTLAAMENVFAYMRRMTIQRTSDEAHPDDVESGIYLEGWDQDIVDSLISESRTLMARLDQAMSDDKARALALARSTGGT